MAMQVHEDKSVTLTQEEVQWLSRTLVFSPSDKMGYETEYNPWLGGYRLLFGSQEACDWISGGEELMRRHLAFMNAFTGLSAL